MWSKTVNKTILIAGLLVLVLAVGILTRTEAGKGYFSWLKASLLKDSQTSQTTEKESKKNNVPNVSYITEKKDETEPEQNSDSVVAERKETEAPKAMTVEEIKIQMDIIKAEASQMEGEIERLAVLNDIKQEMDAIKAKADEIKGEITRLAVLNQLSQISKEAQEIGQKIDEFDRTNVLTGVQREDNIVANEITPLSKGFLPLA